MLLTDHNQRSGFDKRKLIKRSSSFLCEDTSSYFTTEEAFGSSFVANRDNPIGQSACMV